MTASAVHTYVSTDSSNIIDGSPLLVGEVVDVTIDLTARLGARAITAATVGVLQTSAYGDDGLTVASVVPASPSVGFEVTAVASGTFSLGVLFTTDDTQVFGLRLLFTVL